MGEQKLLQAKKSRDILLWEAVARHMEAWYLRNKQRRNHRFLSVVIHFCRSPPEGRSLLESDIGRSSNEYARRLQGLSKRESGNV